MKTYRGSIDRRTGDRSVTVREQASGPAPEVQPRPDLLPPSFSWGYQGRGTDNLAMAILADMLSDSVALQLYQAFDLEVLSQFPPSSAWTLTEDEIHQWVAQKLEAVI